MAWVYLVIAGIMEVIWATSMKYSRGFFKALAQHHYAGFYDYQLRLAFASHENLTAGNSIRGLDRHRGGGFGAGWYYLFW